MNRRARRAARAQQRHERHEDLPEDVLRDWDEPFPPGASELENELTTRALTCVEDIKRVCARHGVHVVCYYTTSNGDEKLPGDIVRAGVFSTVGSMRELLLSEEGKEFSRDYLLTLSQAARGESRMHWPPPDDQPPPPKEQQS